ncbi:MAG: hypothetical protein GX428_02120 [Candidatus Atribacteria bacterium]|nr:hypothetical protein [Candidatus Atribacteria bacterium]
MSRTVFRRIPSCYRALPRWWSSHFNARFILYDPMDLAKVVTGELESYEFQPYTFLDIDDHLFLNTAGIELEML